MATVRIEDLTPEDLTEEQVHEVPGWEEQETLARGHAWLLLAVKEWQRELREVCCQHNEDDTLTKLRAEHPLKVWYWSFIKQSGLGHSNSRYQQFGKQLVSKGFEKRDAYDGKRFTGPELTAEALNAAELDAMTADIEDAKRRACGDR